MYLCSLIGLESKVLTNNFSDDLIELQELKCQLGETVVVQEIQKRSSDRKSQEFLPMPEIKMTGQHRNKPMGDKRGPPKRRRPPMKEDNGLVKKNMEPKRGQNLIEKEKAEIGNVKLGVYKYYLQNIGFDMILIIFGIQILTQAFGIASNAWLGVWSDDDTIMIDGIVNNAKRDMYLGVYGAIGFGQG